MLYAEIKRIITWTVLYVEAWCSRMRSCLFFYSEQDVKKLLETNGGGTAMPVSTLYHHIHCLLLYVHHVCPPLYSVDVLYSKEHLHLTLPSSLFNASLHTNHIKQHGKECIVRCKNRESLAFHVPVRACKQPMIVTIYDGSHQTSHSTKQGALSFCSSACSTITSSNLTSTSQCSSGAKEQ
jgi:hypothetical protein